jgi:hypothetical protein
MPDAVDTTRGVATIFPALTLALIRLHAGDRAAAEAAYAQAGPVRSWTPVPAMRMAAWAHGLAVAIRLGWTQDIEFLAARFEPFRGQHVANGAGPGTYMGPVELPLGQAAAALGQLDPAVDDLRTAASICDTNGARGYAVQARVELAAALTRRQAPGDRDEALAALAAAAADRPDPVRLRADGREPRPAHPDQAGTPQPQPDRRLGQRGAWRESSVSTQADGE